jgi:hypothetical protein
MQRGEEERDFDAGQHGVGVGKPGEAGRSI